MPLREDTARSAVCQGGRGQEKVIFIKMVLLSKINDVMVEPSECYIRTVIVSLYVVPSSLEGAFRIISYSASQNHK